MALVEIDEGELNAHRRVTDAMQKLLANPKTRRRVLEAQKILDPDLSIPELDAAEPVRGEIQELTKKFDAMQSALMADREEREKAAQFAKLEKTWNKGRGKLLASGYTDEGLSAVEKFMEERGIADHEIAAAAFEKFNPPAEPIRAVGGNRFDIFGSEERSSDNMKALFANPDDPNALNNMINDTLRQVRGR